MIDHDIGVEADLNDDLEKKVVDHRKNHYEIIVNIVFQALITTVSYKNFDKIQVDPHRLETLLRLGYDVAIGKTNIDTIVILGWSKHKPVGYDIEDYYKDRNDIIFRIPKKLMLPEYKLITELDNCETGNYIVVSNQYYFYNTDLSIIRHYAKKLAEIEGSRYSLAIQAKCMTLFNFDSDDETSTVAIRKIYNGAPVGKVFGDFSLDDSILFFENASAIATQMVALDQEYSSTLSELCQNLGINGVGIAKASGVSNAEVQANNEFGTAVANTKLKARQEPFNRLNKNMGFNIEVCYDNDKNLEEIPKTLVDIE